MDIENITNEELATAAQEGNNEVMPLLWEKNERLVKLIMFKHLNKRKLPPCIDEEDILQCGYFALLAAVKAYKSGEYKFTTYLNYSIQNAVNECIDGRKRNPDNQREVSYNQRIKNSDGGTSESTVLSGLDIAALYSVQKNPFTPKVSFLRLFVYLWEPVRCQGLSQNRNKQAGGYSPHIRTRRLLPAHRAAYSLVPLSGCRNGVWYAAVFGNKPC